MRTPRHGESPSAPLSPAVGPIGMAWEREPGSAMADTRSVLRGIGAVLLGFIAGAALSVATDALCRAVGALPEDGQGAADWRYVIPLGYRMIYGTVAAALVALLAPEPRWRYVWITGAIGFLLCLAGVLRTIGKGPEFGPLWYPLALALAASVPPTTFVGGWVCLRRRHEARDSGSLAPNGTT